MTALAPFDFHGNAVRVLGTPDAPLFVLADICRVLGLDDVRRVAERIPEADRTQTPVRSGDQRRSMWAVTEAGLYRVVLRSDRPEAESFMQWVTREVLPAIRRTGRYEVAPTPAAIPTHAEALRAWADEVERRERAETAVAELTPRAEAWDQLCDGSGDYSVGDAAKILTRAGVEIGSRRLFQVLREIGWTFQLADGPRAYQRQVDIGRLSELPRTYTHPKTGETALAAPQLRITPKGMEALRSLLAADQEVSA